MYELELSRKAAKFYQKADTATARRLNAAFDRLAEEPLLAASSLWPVSCKAACGCG